MKRTAEAVSLGHPDKTADYISSYILDRLIEQDPDVRYAVEVMVKGNQVILGGEVTGLVNLNNVGGFVKEAIREIGYDEHYANIWGDKALNIRQVQVVNLISAQSPEIGCGVRQNGWGDQGIFAGFACRGEGLINRELFLARKLNRRLYDLARKSDCLGLDIKTQITLADDGHIDTAIVAIPMMKQIQLDDVIEDCLKEKTDRLIVNGTGIYQTHSSIADCGITGRKLACDFYGLACPIGGGSPWTKDASKADLTLNLYARRLAVENLKDYDTCRVYLSSCIGRAELPSAVVQVTQADQTEIRSLAVDKSPADIIQLLGLKKPVFAKLCRDGLTVQN